MTHRSISPIDIKEREQSHQINSDFLYIYKRTERIVAAVFLVTDGLSDSNPIRQRVRLISVEMMTFILSSRGMLRDDSVSFLTRLNSRFLELLSLLEVSFLSEQISTMNFRILSEEISRIIGFLERIQKRVESNYSEPMSKSSKLLSRERLHTKHVDSLVHSTSLLSYTMSDSAHIHQRHPIGHKRHLDVSRTDIVNSNNDKLLAIESRKTAILEILKDGSHLTIKDFSKVVSSLSKKTIQRELMSMVRSNVLKREGQRRWSRYFLAT